MVYLDREAVVAEGTEAVIGAEPDATVRIARPGISRRHVVIKYDDGRWIIQDAASRNGTYHNGIRIETLDIVAPLEIRLGHPTDGELVQLEPTPDGSVDAGRADEPEKEAPMASPAPERPQTAKAAAGAVTDAELRQLVVVLNDTIRALRGLTWSVWAMIATTAVLVVLTLFVAIIGV